MITSDWHMILGVVDDPTANSIWACTVDERWRCVVSSVEKRSQPLLVVVLTHAAPGARALERADRRLPVKDSRARRSGAL